MLDIQQLVQLAAVEESGSLSRAAEKLHLSQPALSRSMQRLEAELGLTLFERSRNRITLNELGLRAAEGARGLLDAAEKYTEDLQDFAASLSTIRIGGCTPASIWRMSTVIREHFPSYAILEEQLVSEKLAEGLLTGHFRLILAEAEVSGPGILCRKYLEERLILELPPDHELSRFPGLTANDMKGLNVLTYRNIGIWRQRVLEHLGFQPIEISELDVLEKLAVISGLPLLMSSLSPSLSTASGRRMRLPIMEDAAVQTLYLCAREDDRKLFDLFF